MIALLIAVALTTTPPTPAGKSCVSSNDCTKTEFCERDVGICSGDGPSDENSSKPGVCTAQGRDVRLDPNAYQPVCSCNYRTMFNRAHAAMQRTNLLHTGACTIDERLNYGDPERFIDASRAEVSAQMLEQDKQRRFGASGVCFENSHCAPGEYCSKHGTDACLSEHYGHCSIKGDFGITSEYPGGVCGCDGVIYKIPIEPSRRGVNIDQTRTRCKM